MNKEHASETMKIGSVTL